MYFPTWDTDSLYPKLKIVTFHINTFHFSVISFVQTQTEASNQQKFLGNPADCCSENNVPSQIQIDYMFHDNSCLYI